MNLPQCEISTIKTDYFNITGGKGMPHHHMHNHYEISLILSGNMHILLSDAAESGIGSFLMLTPPGAPHRVARNPNTKYERINVSFQKSFVCDYIPDGERLLDMFGTSGKILTLTDAQKERLFSLAHDAHTENDLFKQRLILLLYLAEIGDVCKQASTNTHSVPPYIYDALQYLHQNYKQKITAEQIAWSVGVGRTTLMTGFKKYTGSTLNHYLTQYRLQMATSLLRQGQTQQSAAEQCGFSEASNLIRVFTRCYGITPHKYLHSYKNEDIK